MTCGALFPFPGADLVDRAVAAVAADHGAVVAAGQVGAGIRAEVTAVEVVEVVSVAHLSGLEAAVAAEPLPLGIAPEPVAKGQAVPARGTGVRVSGHALEGARLDVGSAARVCARDSDQRCQQSRRGPRADPGHPAVPFPADVSRYEIRL